MIKLNSNQIQALARENMKGSSMRVASCFELVEMYESANMANDYECLFNIQIVATILEGFISDSCYPTFDYKFKSEMKKLGYTIEFDEEGCGYITNDSSSTVIYFG